MKGTKNPLSILKVKNYRKKNKNIGKYPYSRTRSIYAERKEKEKQYLPKN